MAAAASHSRLDRTEITQQKENCTGIVKDMTGETVICASIVVKGTTNGSITGINGNFSLSNATKGDALVISFIGYKTEEVVWNGQPLEITLKDDTQQLDEVVVVGFGTQKKVNLTGAVSMANAGDLASRPVTNVTEALQGMVPGMNFSYGSQGGKVGSTMSINIRGAGTITSSDTKRGSTASPLVLIDGGRGRHERAQRPGHRKHLRPEGCGGLVHLWFARAFRRGAHHDQERPVG